MNERGSPWIAWAMKNACAIICFTVLAVHFEKWWLALFAMLFMSDLEVKEQ